MKQTKKKIIIDNYKSKLMYKCANYFNLNLQRILKSLSQYEENLKFKNKNLIDKNCSLTWQRICRLPKYLIKSIRSTVRETQTFF